MIIPVLRGRARLSEGARRGCNCQVAFFRRLARDVPFTCDDARLFLIVSGGAHVQPWVIVAVRRQHERERRRLPLWAQQVERQRHRRFHP